MTRGDRVENAEIFTARLTLRRTWGGRADDGWEKTYLWVGGISLYNELQPLSTKDRTLFSGAAETLIGDPQTYGASIRVELPFDQSTERGSDHTERICRSNVI